MHPPPRNPHGGTVDHRIRQAVILRFAINCLEKQTGAVVDASFSQVQTPSLVAGSYAPSILSPSAAAPFSNQLPSNLAFTLRLTPMTVGNFSDQLQQNLVGALQQVLPSGTSILITSSEDLVTVGFSRRRRLLTTHAARRCGPATWRWLVLKSSCVLQNAVYAADVVTPAASSPAACSRRRAHQ